MPVTDSIIIYKKEFCKLLFFFQTHIFSASIKTMGFEFVRWTVVGQYTLLGCDSTNQWWLFTQPFTRWICILKWLNNKGMQHRKCTAKQKKGRTWFDFEVCRWILLSTMYYMFSSTSRYKVMSYNTNKVYWFASSTVTITVYKKKQYLSGMIVLSLGHLNRVLCQY